MNERAATTCAAFEDVAEELAIGTVDEPDRSVFLAHAASCADCHSLLADLSEIGDRLLHFAPQVEPPVGFETRAVARMTRDAPRRGADAWRRVLAIAAAVAVALLAGLLLGRATGSASDDVASGPLVRTSGEVIGTAELDADASRIVLTMTEDGTWPGEWTCELLADDGTWVDVGRWRADEVTGGVWAAGVPASLTDAPRMRIRNDAGRVVATAALDA